MYETVNGFGFYTICPQLRYLFRRVQADYKLDYLYKGWFRRLFGHNGSVTIKSENPKDVASESNDASHSTIFHDL